MDQPGFRAARESDLNVVIINIMGVLKLKVGRANTDRESHG